MKLHELQPVPGSTKSKKRVGRGEGSGWGKTSGRGHKGQRSRAGQGKRRGFEGGQMPMHRRLPKRGFKNPFRTEYTVVNLADLEKYFDADSTVGPEELAGRSLIKSNLPVKVLGHGKLTKKLTVQAHKFSQTAQQAIESAGGKAVVIENGNADAQQGAQEAQ